MEIKLRERTRETVVHYFTHTQTKEIRRFLPQKARTVEEALVDYEKTLLPGAGSFGRSIYFNGSHVGDIWCYGIQKEDPNAMVSYCVFDKVARGKGVATEALGLFLLEIKKRFDIRTVGAFTFADNTASTGVLRKNGFALVETFTENGRESAYFQL